MLSTSILVDVASDALLAHLVEERPGAADLVRALGAEAGNTMLGCLTALVAATALDGAGDVAFVPAANLLGSLDYTDLQAGANSRRA